MAAPLPPAADDRPYAGRLLDGAHRFALRVYYEDTDAGGIVYHAGYLRFMERARTDMLALAGIDIAAAARAGEGHFVVTDAHLRFRRSAALGDALVIESRITELRGASCLVQQSVMRDGQEVVEGRLTIAFVGSHARPRRLPPRWKDALGAIMGAGCEA